MQRNHFYCFQKVVSLHWFYCKIGRIGMAWACFYSIQSYLEVVTPLATIKSPTCMYAILDFFSSTILVEPTCTATITKYGDVKIVVCFRST